jgi:hypothetical protein
MKSFSEQQKIINIYEKLKSWEKLLSRSGKGTKQIVQREISEEISIIEKEIYKNDSE